MTQVSLDALWKIQIEECIKASKSSKVLIYPEKETDYDSLLYHMEEGTLSMYQMEEGTLSPKPQELPMPPPAWLV